MQLPSSMAATRLHFFRDLRPGASICNLPQYRILRPNDYIVGMASCGKPRSHFFRSNQTPRHFTALACNNLAVDCRASVIHHSKRKINSSIKIDVDGAQTNSLATGPFQKLVKTLQSKKQTCTIVESSCGGLISSSLMSVPGSSRVYFGGTVAYNTKRSGKLLCGDEELHDRLLHISSKSSDFDDDNHGIDIPSGLSEETQKYILSKIKWTAETATAYCRHMNTDYAIAEGGATGPTFRPKGMTAGFGVFAVAGKCKKGYVGADGEEGYEILAQKVIYSDHADRESNMRLYADAAAELCLGVISAESPQSATKTVTSGTVNTMQSSSTTTAANEVEYLHFDRSSHLRGDDAAMQEFFKRSDSLHVVLRGANEVLFKSSTELALPTLHDLCKNPTLGALWMTGDNGDSNEILEKRTFLGRLGPSKVPLFAVSLPQNAHSEQKSSDSEYGECYFANTRTRAPLLQPLHNELALTATAFVQWQNTHRYCCMCGAQLEFIQGGTCARCTTTEGKPHLHWPRQDPSIIVLVTNSSSTHALMARSPRHPHYLYTALAGFVEAGETMENAVSREVSEETGVEVDGQSISYVASQSWPFPRSCMIGFHARTPVHVEVENNGFSPIKIDPHELVDAQWFEKEAVYQATRDANEIGPVMDRELVEKRLDEMAKHGKGGWNGKLLVPPKGVLARTLIDRWLESA